MNQKETAKMFMTLSVQLLVVGFASTISPTGQFKIRTLVFEKVAM
jgi:hypothetical protein